MRAHTIVANDMKIVIPPWADIPRNFRPDGNDSLLLQELLSDMDTQDLGAKTIIETVDGLKRKFRLEVVGNNNRTPEWHIHRGHKARQPQISPFLRVARAPLTDKLTVMVTSDLHLVRVIVGEYVPPLPWQSSAKQEQGGIRTCRDFWRRHSYVYSDSRVCRTRDSSTPPHWFAQK